MEWQSSGKGEKGMSIHRSRGLPTSMLDVSFVLVMMFLLLSTLAKTTSESAAEQARTAPVPVASPDMDEETARHVGMTDMDSQVITIDHSGDYYIDQRRVSFEKLSSYLVTTRPPIVDIRPDVNASIGRLTRLLACCHKHGLTPSIGYHVAAESE